ncbi:MAG: glutamine synthetase III, partial [Bacteroidaceae bacterium]|nr:glutamine synthetase III [Bacteroidaceae bacterium]
MANELRFQVVGEAFKKKPLDVQAPSERPCEYFGKHVFNREKMYKYLPKGIYEKMIDVMDNGARLDRTVADAIAAGMMQWAKENGVTHYTHWFQPLTEGTAEKHDSFIEHDGKG